MTIQQLPDKALNPLEVWKIGFRLWKSTFKHIQLLTLYLVVWLFLPFFLFGGINFTDHNLVTQQNIEQALFIPVYTLVTLVIYTTVYFRLSYELKNEHKPTFRESIPVTFKKVIWLIPAVFISVASLVAGYFFFVLPGIYLTVVLSLYYPLIIIDDLGPFAAIKRCLQLISGKWWHTACVVLVPTSLFLLIAALIEHFTVGIGNAAFTQPSPTETWIIHHIAKMVLATVYFPYYAAIVVVQLHNLKVQEQPQPQQDSTRLNGCSTLTAWLK